MRSGRQKECDKEVRRCERQSRTRLLRREQVRETNKQLLQLILRFNMDTAEGMVVQVAQDKKKEEEFAGEGIVMQIKRSGGWGKKNLRICQLNIGLSRCRMTM